MDRIGTDSAEQATGLQAFGRLAGPVGLRFVAAGLAVSGAVAVAGPVIVPRAGAGPAGVAAVALLLAVVFAAGRIGRHHPHGRLGAANLVTLLRAGVAGLLAVPLVLPGGVSGDGALGWTMAALVAAALALDGLDGWLARRSGLASAFGARFDMETDAVLAALLSLHALQAGKAGLWVIALGFMRYGFVAAARVWPWLDAPLPARFSRKAVCVVQIGVLTLLLAPPVVPPLSQALAGGALALLAWSFAVDVRWLRARRGRR